MRSRIQRRSLLVGAALAVTACGSEAADTPAAAPVEAPTEQAPSTSATPTTAPSTTTSGPATTASPPTTERPAPTTSITTTAAPEPGPDCRRLEDFDLDAGAWVIVNDGVMGGRSDGRGTVEDSTLRFFGTVVTAGGGFTSVRLRLDGTELDETEYIRARVRLDDRTYGFTFEDDQAVEGRRVSHGADLPSPTEVGPDGFAVVELAYADLRPSIFGFEVPAEPFDPDAAREIGIIIADGIDGEFQLDVDWIDACA